MTTIVDLKKLTFQEYRHLEFDDDDPFLYELINGILVKRAAPSLLHQHVVGEIYNALKNYCNETQAGYVFAAPTDVCLDNQQGQGPQPDISFVLKERSFLLENEDFINGAPDLVVEVISPSTGKNDRGEKKDLYEQFAVKEYWLVDPANKTIEIYVMRNNAYRLASIQDDSADQIASILLPNFKVKLPGLFKLL